MAKIFLHLSPEDKQCARARSARRMCTWWYTSGAAHTKYVPAAPSVYQPCTHPSPLSAEERSSAGRGCFKLNLKNKLSTGGVQYYLPQHFGTTYGSKCIIVIRRLRAAIWPGVAFGYHCSGSKLDVIQIFSAFHDVKPPLMGTLTGNLSRIFNI